MVDLGKIYPVFFNQGASGTFLVYLINLHNEFNKVELYKCYSKMTAQQLVLDKIAVKTKKTVYHVMLDSASWRWTFNGKDPNPEIVPYGFDEWKEKAERRLGKNWTEKKLAIKMLPHDLIDESISMTAIKNYLKSMNPIIIKIGSEEFYNNWILKRYKQNSLDSYTTTDSYNSMNARMDNAINEFNKLNINYHLVNIENILNLDNEEYQKLVDYLKTDVLDNWKDVVIEYKNLLSMD